MNADMKAAVEWASSAHANLIASFQQRNLAAAFLELQAELEQERKAHESLKAEWGLKVIDLHNERKAREKAEFHRQRHCDTHKQFGPIATCGYCDQLAIVDLEQRTTELQRGLDEMREENYSFDTEKEVSRYRLALHNETRRAADLQARLERVEAEMIERCATACRKIRERERNYTYEQRISGIGVAEDCEDAIRALSAQPKAVAGQKK